MAASQREPPGDPGKRRDAGRMGQSGGFAAQGPAAGPGEKRRRGSAAAAGGVPGPGAEGWRGTRSPGRRRTSPAGGPYEADSRLRAPPHRAPRWKRLPPPLPNSLEERPTTFVINTLSGWTRHPWLTPWCMGTQTSGDQIRYNAIKYEIFRAPVKQYVLVPVPNQAWQAATASISTRTSFGKRLTSTAARAGL